MALNKFMHPRNRYKNNRPDFAKLRDKYPDFKPFLSYNDKGKATLDFKDPEALRALTCTLLKDDFDLDLDVPLDHIIPTVPLRLNYIHWLEDLLEGIPSADNVWGIDIGCGTSCIYPLLGAKMNGWNFWASEVDPLALQYANENVNRNQLGGQIQVIENTSNSLFVDLINETKSPCPSKFHFTMCNPPFFGNVLEAQGMLSSRSFKRSEPSSVSTADEVEMIVEGGEVDFVKRMIQESQQVSQRVVWFTSMLGKKSSVGQIVAELRRQKVPTWTTTEFCQGRTMRWGVAWSYVREAKKQQTPTKKHGKVKPPLSVPVLSEYITKLFQKMQTDSTTTAETDSITTDSKQKTQGRGRQEKVQAVAMVMEQLMKSLEDMIGTYVKVLTIMKDCFKLNNVKPIEIVMTVTKQASTKWNPRYDLVANKNTWSHQRRKRRLAKMKKKHRDRGASDEIRGSDVKPHVKLCSSRVLDTPDVNTSRLKFDKDCSENTTSQGKPETSPPAGGVHCVKLPISGSDNFLHSNQSEQVTEDMQIEVNAERGYHSNNGNFMSKEENGADEAEIVQCDEKSICQKNSVQSAKRVKWKEDEIREISDFEPAKKQKRLVYNDGFLCSDGGEDRITLVVDGDREMTCDNSAGQKENGTSHSKLSMENVSPGSKNQVQNEACDGQSKTKSICGSTDVHLSSGESEFCKNKGEIPKPTEEKTDDALGSHCVNVCQTQRNEEKFSISYNIETKSNSASETKGGKNLCSMQEGVVSHLAQGASSSGHVHTSICMSSSDPGSSSDVEPSGPLLKCVMEVKLVTKASVEVVFSCDPSQNRELLHQVAQYVKNHIARESKV